MSEILRVFVLKVFNYHVYVPLDPTYLTYYLVLVDPLVKTLLCLDLVSVPEILLVVQIEVVDLVLVLLQNVIKLELTLLEHLLHLPDHVPTLLLRGAVGCLLLHLLDRVPEVPCLPTQPLLESPLHR